MSPEPRRRGDDTGSVCLAHSGMMDLIQKTFASSIRTEEQVKTLFNGFNEMKEMIRRVSVESGDSTLQHESRCPALKSFMQRMGNTTPKDGISVREFRESRESRENRELRGLGGKSFIQTIQWIVAVAVALGAGIGAAIAAFSGSV